MNKMKYCPVCSSELIDIQIEDKTRLGCSAKICNYIFWDSPTPVLAAIIEHKGEVILARNKAWPENIFGLITGFLEKGETPESGIIREVDEELGLSGEIIELVGVYAFEKMNQVLIVYHIIAQGEVNLGEELAQIKYVPVEKLRPWPFGTGLALEDWLEKRK